ncbi:hypothetical protein BJX76DRAFT_357599 [Aspergillus varians]
MDDAPNRRRWWTQEEDRILQDEVRIQLETGGEQGSRNWNSIAEKLPGRSNKDCRKRWTKISLSSRKGTWSGAEDQLLRKAVSKCGFQWTKVAEMVGSRHPDQCAKRWHHSLDPNVNRSPWTPEEDSCLVDAVQRIGRDWKEIGRECFPNRSTTDIKNRYVILSRRQNNRSTITAGVDNDTAQFMDSKHLNPMGIFSPDVDLSFATTPYDVDFFNLAPDAIGMPLPTDLPPYLFNDSSNPSHPDIPSTNFLLGESNGPAWDAPDWAEFDKQHLVSLNPLSLSPGASAPSETESYDRSLLTNGSPSDSPSISEGSGLSASSTLVLEHLQPETVNLVIDTLLRTNSKFGMRLYNTGS